jgi:WD40 repeat protein
MSSCVFAEDVPTFEADVAPIFTKYCAGCHNADELEGGLSLESFAALQNGGEHGPAIFSGDSGASRLIQVLTGSVEPKMPPEDEPQPDPADIDTLRRWIDSGARGPDGQSITITRLATPELPPSLAAKPITAIAFSPDGRFLAVARFRSVEIRTADGQRLIHTFHDAIGKVNSLNFFADGRLVAASGFGGLAGEVCIWNLSTAKLERRIRGHRDIIDSAVPSPNGRWIATGSYDRTIIVWDAGTGEAVRTIRGHNGAVHELAFSSDSRLLASASADTTIKIWDVASGERRDTLSQPLKEQYSVAISPDDEFVFGCGEDNRIRKWQLISKEEARINPLLIARFGHEQAVERLRVSPNGQLVVSVSSDWTLRVWDAETLTQLRSFDGQSDSGQALAIDPSSRRVAVGRMDGSLDLYDLPTKTQPAEPVRIVMAPTSRSESGVATSIVELTEVEPNNSITEAPLITRPAVVRGIISAPADSSADRDLFRFASQAGQAWYFEVKASRDKSPLDSHVAVLDQYGKPVPRVLLQAVRDSYFTFRGKDSMQTGDFRVHNWREMRLNQYLYASGEVVKLYHYPRGPDSGFNVYPNFGNRHGFFDTTPLTHALGEPCYIVQPYPPSTQLVANGLPTFPLNYENDDASHRRFGSDSELAFVTPADGEYHVVVRDVRGFGGDQFKYQLIARAPQPDFRVSISGQNPVVAPGTGRKFGIEVERQDGFDDEIRIDIAGLPPGFSVTSPIIVEAGQLRAWGTVTAGVDAAPPSAEAASASTVTAVASVNGHSVTKQVGSLGEIKLGERPKLAILLTSDSSTGATDPRVIDVVPGTTTTASLRIDRQGVDGPVGFGGEEAIANTPHGVYVDNIGLNGVLIPEGQTTRTIFITAEPWVQATERLVFIEAAIEHSPTSAPILMRILPRSSVAAAGSR